MKSLVKRLVPDTSPIRLLYHRLKALLAAIAYGFPARKLTIIGITGTDGKTTTVGMTAHILNACGIKTGALSTAFFQVGTDVSWNPTQKTSPSPFLVQRFLRQLLDAGCTHAVIECSSHGLLQGRVNHLYPKVAAITNLSEEHLDYHGTMDLYIAAKSLLFKMLGKDGIKVLNADDASFETLYTAATAHSLVYSPTHDLRDVHATTASSEATAHILKEDYALLLRVPGTFNLSNALCAICCAIAGTGVSVEQAIRALGRFKGIPGRMERIDVGQDFSVFVDFTVTPMSYQSTLRALRAMLQPGKRLLVLTGSCGDRMKEKRPIVGGLVASYAHIAVVTNEDPYTEDPERIIDEVLKGVPGEVTIYCNAAAVPPETELLNKFFVRISDRLEAIKFLLSQAKTGDIVVLCGKGTDITMMTKEGQVPWNEREIVKEELRIRN